jgi:hypothetical protein
VHLATQVHLAAEQAIKNGEASWQVSFHVQLDWSLSDESLVRRAAYDPETDGIWFVFV